MLYDTIIIGSGPAGYTAGIYATRAGLKTLILEGENYGGQLMTTTEVYNFPGFPDGINGCYLMNNMRQQCINHGCEIISEDVVSVNMTTEPFTVTTRIMTYNSRSMIIATGATAKKLNIPNGEIFWNNGISACAVCDGALPVFRNKQLVVVGGGDTACEEASHLSKFGSKVYVLVRSDKMRASHHMKEKISYNEKIQILYNTEVMDVSGIINDDLIKLQQVYIINNLTNEKTVIDIAGLFYAIGHKPNVGFLNGALKMDDSGYIISNNTKTEIPGVFVCGDVQDNIYRQAITAAGSGCIAALEVEKYLTLL